MSKSKRWFQTPRAYFSAFLAQGQPGLQYMEPMCGSISDQVSAERSAWSQLINPNLASNGIWTIRYYFSSWLNLGHVRFRPPNWIANPWWQSIAEFYACIGLLLAVLQVYMPNKGLEEESCWQGLGYRDMILLLTATEERFECTVSSPALESDRTNIAGDLS